MSPILNKMQNCVLCLDVRVVWNAELLLGMFLLRQFIYLSRVWLDSIFSWVFVDDDILFCFCWLCFLEEWIVRIGNGGIQSFQRVQVAMSLVDRYILGAHHNLEKHL
jgi:hypothetical protein